jgi:hypothetical protein
MQVVQICHFFAAGQLGRDRLGPGPNSNAGHRITGAG